VTNIGATCEAMQRLALLRDDGTLGWLNRRTLDRHLAGCADCRAFVAAAGALTRRAADLLEVEPPSHVLRTIAEHATLALPMAGGSRDTEQRWWAGAFAGGAVLAAAAGLILALVHPAAFSPRPAKPAQFDARLALAQQELDQFATEPSTRPGRISIDDRIRSIEHQLRCLDTDLDEIHWNTLKQGSSCTDS